MCHQIFSRHVILNSAYFKLRKNMKLDSLIDWGPFVVGTEGLFLMKKLPLSWKKAHTSLRMDKAVPQAMVQDMRPSCIRTWPLGCWDSEWLKLRGLALDQGYSKKGGTAADFFFQMQNEVVCSCLLLTFDACIFHVLHCFVNLAFIF